MAEIVSIGDEIFFADARGAIRPKDTQEEEEEWILC